MLRPVEIGERLMTKRVRPWRRRLALLGGMALGCSLLAGVRSLGGTLMAPGFFGLELSSVAGIAGAVEADMTNHGVVEARPMPADTSVAGVATAAHLAGVGSKSVQPGRGAVTKSLAPPAAGRWGGKINLPLVPASAANLPNGKVMFWSSDSRFDFGIVGRVHTALFDPVAGIASERLVDNVDHNMFCPGTTNLADGRILVSGGSNAAMTSIYDPDSDRWSRDPRMNIARAYQANTILRDGSVFTLGGSWAGGYGAKHAEIWRQASGWSLLPGVKVDGFLTADPAGVYRADNHMWLLPAGNGKVFHAGPSADMHWIDTTGEGSVQSAGRRGDDGDSMSGNAVMFDTGRILKVGGSTAYDNVDASAASYVIDIRGEVKVRRVQSMSYARAFHNSVVLPNGQVMVIGGQSHPVPFSDNTSVLVPELWDPVSETFTVLQPMSVPRNYHSVALLLPDARVISAGGGLCGIGCAGNHPDAQIFSPHYLFNEDGSPAKRPVILSAPGQAVYGTDMEVTTDSLVSSFALIRLASTTHTVNNDQRRLSLRYQRLGENRYAVTVPSNPGWALPGQYMLFAMNEQGVPSVAKIVLVGRGATPTLSPVQDQYVTQGAPAILELDVPGAKWLEVEGLPPGLSFDTSAAAVWGTPTAAGTYTVTVHAGNHSGIVSTDFLWKVAPPQTVRFVKLEQTSEVRGGPWASIAELNLLDEQGQALDRSAWKVRASSEEGPSAEGSGAAANAIDGDPTTLWHTRYRPEVVPPPHQIVVDLGAPQRLSGMRYLPRTSGVNGVFAGFRLSVSADGVNWSAPIAEGDFTQIDPDPNKEKIVRFAAIGSIDNHPPILTLPGNQRHYVGERLSLSLLATDDRAGALRFSAAGLPRGLRLNSESGVISGKPEVAGHHAVTVTVYDADGASAFTRFNWKILELPPPLPTVQAPVVGVGAQAVFFAQTPVGIDGLSYAWDFGDGRRTGFSSSPRVRHTYAKPGLYMVTLQVRGVDGQITIHRFTRAVAYPATATTPGASASIVWEPAAAGRAARVWAVNPDNDSVTVFNAETGVRLAEIPVGRGPRALTLLPGRGQIWVTNRDSATVTVIDSARRKVSRTLAMPRASQPWGIVASPRGDRTYVALEAGRRVLQLEASGRISGSLSLPGAPRHLALTSDGARLLVSRFISPPQPGEATANVRARYGNGAIAGGQVWALTTAPLALNKTIILRHSQRPDSTTQGRGVPNYLGAPAISPDGRSAWIPSKQDNIYRGLLRDGQHLDFENTVRAIGSRIVLDTLTEDHAKRLDYDNSSLASASVFHPSGAYLFTALETSRHVAVVDPVRGREVFRFDVGRAPQGLAVSDDGMTLVVSNFTDRTISVHDLKPLIQFGRQQVPTRDVWRTVAVEKLSPRVLQGKQLFYDARDQRLARDGYMSCASCHSEGGGDGRTWDMTGRGEGLRNTISLQGRAGAQGRLHWSGNFDEVQDFEEQIRTLAGGIGLMRDDLYQAGTRSQPLGDRKAGLSQELDALAAYVASLDRFAPSPWRRADGRLTQRAQAGRVVFQASCADCHGGRDFTSSRRGRLVDVGTLKPNSGRRLEGALNGLDVPTLRDVWATAPYLHDGSASSLSEAVRAHTALPPLSADDLANVSAYVAQIDGTEPGENGVQARYIRFEATSEVRGGPWASMAEFELLEASGSTLPREKWRVTESSSEESQLAENFASHILDGDPRTFWHTRYSSPLAGAPHWVVIDIGEVRRFSGFRYLPRPGGGNGTIDDYRLYVSDDGRHWGAPVAQGKLSAVAGSVEMAKAVMLD